ncbi:hypothetical protein [Arsenophonus apicola]|uniref:Uncharacterized protein n=1 Tax=Arsenophonus apicola TaxID=2879119 RepID=A0ABY8P0G0_9GAMM|nr:hypothetical protein [Arsenophonus apicola]WGO82709.1 hypothetical protein QG404_10030 [Arsenophonus apicola]
MRTLSKVLFITVLFPFATFNSSAKVDNYVKNYHGGHVGHGGGHSAHSAHSAHASHSEHTGIHSEHGHHEGHGEQQEHADLSSPDPSFYPKFTDTITPCHNAQHNISLCDS